METNSKISKKTSQTILKLQQNEITEHAIYMNLAKRVKKQGDREMLQRIGREEGMHSKLWSKYTKRELKPQKLKVIIYSLLSIILGYTFVIKLMEKGEVVSQNSYALLAKEVPEAHKIYLDEQKHEKALIDMLDEDRLQYIGSMVLGLNDALVELTGTLAGLSFALQNNKLVALSGLITGISATLSMASSEYLSARSEGNADAKKSALYTGVMYIVAVILLILPYLIFPNNKYIHALVTMLIIVVLIILSFTYYISVAKDLPFKKRFLEMATISLSVAGLSFIVGILVKKFLGIDI
ncbi:VIT1/CCC1 transporter family protein [Tepidimicrobium xylanilyticum]|uniref:VIT1/CCC1 transporter family protein n=1 Tax=Tepidimicrobium xylanilyticum TaxID=1123352 RepID=UPI0026571A3E|nr:VIT1/CCC1 transporter family protein [Tepidimicrobium xylanilyticum]GMG95946.1 membrane protein [Tepidimicrobium xylanilyticum]